MDPRRGIDILDEATAIHTSTRATPKHVRDTQPAPGQLNNTATQVRIEGWSQSQVW